MTEAVSINNEVQYLYILRIFSQIDQITVKSFTWRVITCKHYVLVNQVFLAYLLIA